MNQKTQKTMGLCKLCLQYKILVKAHIFPTYFYEANTFLINSDFPFKQKRPTGVYDPNILCKECDNYFGKEFDEFAHRVLIERKDVIPFTGYDSFDLATPIKYYKLQNKDGYTRLARFFISVLWRASISSHKDVSDFNLGKYEIHAKNSILPQEFDFSRYFSVSLCYLNNYPSPISLIPSKKIRIHGLNFYSFIIGSYKVFVKCDKQKLHAALQNTFLSNENDFLMFEADGRETPEHKIICSMYDKLITKTRHSRIISN